MDAVDLPLNLSPWWKNKVAAVTHYEIGGTFSSIISFLISIFLILPCTIAIPVMPALTTEALKKDKSYLKLTRRQQKEFDAIKKRHSKVRFISPIRD